MQRILSRFMRAVRDTYVLLNPVLPWSGAFGIAFHITYYAAHRGEDISGFLALRSFCCVFLIPVLLIRLLERTALARVLPLYVFIAAILLLPFFSAYVLIHTASMYPASVNLIATLQIQFALCVILFVMAIADMLVASYTVFVGVVLAFAFYTLLGNQLSIEVLSEFWFQLSPIMLLVLLLATYHQRNREVFEQEKVRAMEAIGSSMGHELRTPLLGITTRLQSIRQQLPTLVAHYQGVDQASLPRISKRKLELLSEACEDIEEEAKFANTLVDIFLANINKDPGKGELNTAFDLRSATQEALSRYPYLSEAERSLIRSDLAVSAELNGSKDLFVHVVFNLMRNAIHFAQQVPDPRVAIELRRPSERRVDLIVEDNGPGIPKKDVAKIFSRFYSTREGGSGIGLSFVQSVVDSMKASIRVESVPYSYTRFTVSFASDYLES